MSPSHTSQHHQTKSPSDASSNHSNSNTRNNHQNTSTDSNTSKHPSSAHLLACLHKLISIGSEYYELNFSETPLLKPLVLFTGSQSSGKSSIINYLYSMSLRLVGEQACDEKFTIVECVSEEEFEAIVDGKVRRMDRRLPKGFRKPDFTSVDHLRCLFKPKLDNNETDARNGTVFYKLPQLKLMKRYEQFFSHSELGPVLRENSLLEGFVVNEKYVRNTELRSADGKKYSNIVRDVLFLDTPGLNDCTMHSLTKFRAFIQVLEFFYKQSQYCFFVSDPSHLRSIGNSVRMLEIMMADAKTKELVFEKVGQRLNDPHKQKPQSDGSQKESGGISLSLSNLIVDVAASALKRSIPYWSSSTGVGSDDDSDNDFGLNQLYDKVYFVINKADKVRNLHSAFFELGLSLGRNLTTLPLPHANRILAVGLPMEQRFQIFRYGFSSQNDDKRFKKMVSTMKWDGTIPSEISVGQLDELEDLLCSLRNEDTKKQCLLAYLDFVFSSIRQARERDTNYFSKSFRKLKHFYSEPWTRAKTVYNEVLGASDLESLNSNSESDRPPS